MTVRVKICGITRIEDAQAAIAAGADMIGLNFYAKSPRYVELDRAIEHGVIQYLLEKPRFRLLLEPIENQTGNLRVNISRALPPSYSGTQFYTG